MRSLVKSMSSRRDAGDGARSRTGCPRGGEEAEGDFGEPELGSLGGDEDVAEGELKPPPRQKLVDGADERLAKVEVGVARGFVEKRAPMPFPGGAWGPPARERRSA
jgi:hypothetical protein